MELGTVGVKRKRKLSMHMMKIKSIEHVYFTSTTEQSTYPVNDPNYALHHMPLGYITILPIERTSNRQTFFTSHSFIPAEGYVFPQPQPEVLSRLVLQHDLEPIRQDHRNGVER